MPISFLDKLKKRIVGDKPGIINQAAQDKNAMLDDIYNMQYNNSIPKVKEKKKGY